MRVSPPQVVAVFAILICLVSSTINFAYHGRVLDQIRFIDQTIKKRIAMSVTTEWTSGGKTRSWTTTGKDGESAADVAKRHKEELEAAYEEFPPDK